MAEKVATKNRAESCYSARQGGLKGKPNQNLTISVVYSADAWIWVLLVMSKMHRALGVGPGRCGVLAVSEMDRCTAEKRIQRAEFIALFVQEQTFLWDVELILQTLQRMIVWLSQQYQYIPSRGRGQRPNQSLVQSIREVLAKWGAYL
jgi:hypothetical protein